MLLGWDMTNFHAGHQARGATLVRRLQATRWLAALAACAVVLACATLLSARTARAATIDGAITSITTTATGTAQWDTVDFACTWAVPDGSAPGDTFSLDLPSELRWFGATDFVLAGRDGLPVASAHADASGHVVFTLTDYVLTHVDVHGSCHFSTQYVAETTDETVDLDFQVGDEVVRVDLPTVGPCAGPCTEDRTVPSKYMWWSDAAQTTTRSAVRAPATTSDSSDVTIADTPGPGLALDCATVAVTIGTVLDAAGDVTDPRDDGTYVPKISCTPQGVSVTWSQVPAGEYTELRVLATVVDPTATTYTNGAVVSVNGQDTPVHDEVRRSDAGGDGTGSATTTTTSSTTATTTTTGSTTATTTTTGSTTATSTTATTASSTTATASGTITSPASTDHDVVTTGGGGAAGALVTPDDSSLAFTGIDVLELVAVGSLLLGSGAVLSGLARRRRRH